MKKSIALATFVALAAPLAALAAPTVQPPKAAAIVTGGETQQTVDQARDADDNIVLAREAGSRGRHRHRP